MKSDPGHLPGHFVWKLFKKTKPENVGTFSHPLATFVPKGAPGALRDHVETIGRKKIEFWAFFSAPEVGVCSRLRCLAALMSPCVCVEHACRTLEASNLKLRQKLFPRHSRKHGTKDSDYVDTVDEWRAAKP